MNQNQSERSVRAMTQYCENDNHWMGNLSVSHRCFPQHNSQEKQSNRNHVAPQFIIDQSKYSQVQQINNKMIEMNALKQSYDILKSQNESLNLILKDKQLLIQEMKLELLNYVNQSQRIDEYQLLIEERDTMIKQIEQEMTKMSEQCQYKQQLIEKYRTQADDFYSNTKEYETNMNNISKQFLKMTQEKNRMQSVNDENEKLLQEIKEKYLTACRRIQQIPEIQIKLKSMSSINVELEKRINDLIETNERLKIEFSSKQHSQRRFLQLQSDIKKCHSLMQQKEIEISQLKTSYDKAKQELNQLRIYKQNHLDDEKQLQTKTKELKSSKNEIQQLKTQNSSLSKDILKISQQNKKIIERSDNIDQLFKENKRLITMSKQKIDKIEILQHEIQNLNCQITTLTSQKQTLINQKTELEKTGEEIEKDFLEEKERNEELECKINQYQKQIQSGKIDCESLQTQFEEKSAILITISSQNKQLKNIIQCLNEKQLSLQDSNKQLQQKVLVQSHQIVAFQDEIKQLNTSIQDLLIKEQNNTLTIKTLQSDNVNLQQDISILNDKIRTMKTQNEKLLKWKTSYMHFLDSVSKTKQKMHQNYEKLLAE